MTGGLGAIPRAPLLERNYRQRRNLASVALHATSRSDKLSQLFMSAHDEPLSVAMRDLLALSAVVENGYDR